MIDEAAASRLPKTARGRRTHRLLLDAATDEFGEKGFHDASISAITARAGVATGTFYTYFSSKEAVFTALVRDLSDRVGTFVRPHLTARAEQIEAERAAQLAYLEFARAHKEIYRIIDEAEFVAPASYREHYERFAERITARLTAAASRGEISDGSNEVRAWAMMGMNVFLGLRYCVWDESADLPEVARAGGDLLTFGLSPARERT